MSEKAYAQKAKTGQAGKIWCISYHWMTHPVKPGSLKKAFDLRINFG